jgi:transposase
MDYFAGLDISMDETHICVVDRDGAAVSEQILGLSRLC